MNAFKDYRTTSSDLLSPDDLLTRIQYLNDIVYPAVNDKSKRNREADTVIFNERNKNKVFDLFHFISGSWVLVKDELRSDKVSPRYEGPFDDGIVQDGFHFSMIRGN
jgi:glutathionyl-hydroquinone reductase